MEFSSWLAEQSKIDNILNKLIFFFKHKGKIFGCGEEGRITFAQMKDKKDEENTPTWRKEINFMALNLKDYLDGKQTHSVFQYKDLPDIKVIDRKKVENALSRQ